MTIVMTGFALLISAMFVASILASLAEASREAREARALVKYRIF